MSMCSKIRISPGDGGLGIDGTHQISITNVASHLGATITNECIL
jgi:hypothetical protein